MATRKEITEFESLGAFFKDFKRRCEFQGKIWKEDIRNDPDLSMLHIIFDTKT